jgi:hypothetical protein
MGVDKMNAPRVDLPPPLSGNPKKDWDSHRHRESTVGDRLARRWRLRRVFPGDGPSERSSGLLGRVVDALPDVIGWAVTAAVVVALLYLIWYGLVFFQVV